MPTVRQMPGLYIRGSLANVTMKNLSKEEKQHVDEVLDYVMHHPRLSGHKTEFLTALSRTIRGDYRDNRTAGEQEFQIAVWRGVVDLLYNHSYSFKCEACNSNTYLTKREKPAPINRCEPHCPNCGAVKVTDPGDTTYKQGEFVHYETFQESYKNFTDTQKSPTCTTPIIPIKGTKKYEDPQKVLSDPNQLAKFFGEFIWNYFRQQINENSRQEHHRNPNRIVGPADEVIVEEILSLCARLEIDHDFCRKLSPEDGKYRIRVNCLQTPPEFTAEYTALVAKARDAGVRIENTLFEIIVHAGSTSTLEAFVTKPEHVLVLDNCACIDDEDGESPVMQITYRTIGEERVRPDDHISVVESSDVLTAIRHSLPEGDARSVFDILTQNGEKYEEFSNSYDDSTQSNIAEFLHIPPRAVCQHKTTIRHLMLANGLVP